MANLKISQLGVATTPLVGTEILPVVQSGSTKGVSVADLTVGRAVSAASVTASTGNFVVGTAGQGLDFSATPGTGTSEVLDDYEEGNWTPTMTSASGTVTVTASSGQYTKIGNTVFVNFSITYNTDASVGISSITIGGLPFASVPTYYAKVQVSLSNQTQTDLVDGFLVVNASDTTIAWLSRSLSQSGRTGAQLWFVAQYFST